nr:YjbF family lipoprotein [Rhodanobacter sp. DHG33]
MVAIAATAQTGCTPVSSAATDAVKLLVSQHQNHAPTAATVAALPYYQLAASTRDGQAVLILGNVDGVREDWYGNNHVVVFLEHGQLTGTAGLLQNLDGLRQPANNPFTRGLQHLSVPTEYTYTVDWSPGYRYGVPVKARFIPAGSAQLEILGQVHGVLRIDEELDAPAAGWHATNHYWVDPADGFVWKSVQQIAPGLPITLLQLHPYRGQSS